MRFSEDFPVTFLVFVSDMYHTCFQGTYLCQTFAQLKISAFTFSFILDHLRSIVVTLSFRNGLFLLTGNTLTNQHQINHSKMKKNASEAYANCNS